MKLLQTYPISDVEIVLRQAYSFTTTADEPPTITMTTFSQMNGRKSLSTSESNLGFDDEAPQLPADFSLSQQSSGLMPSISSPMKRLSAQFNNFLLNGWTSGSSSSVDMGGDGTKEQVGAFSSIQEAIPPSQHGSEQESLATSSASLSPRRSWISILARSDNIARSPDTALPESARDK